MISTDVPSTVISPTETSIFGRAAKAVLPSGMVRVAVPLLVSRQPEDFPRHIRSADPANRVVADLECVSRAVHMVQELRLHIKCEALHEPQSYRYLKCETGHFHRIYRNLRLRYVYANILSAICTQLSETDFFIRN